AMHMRQMIGYFRRPEDRQETFVILYLRIQDMQIAKVFLCRFGKEAEVARLRHRLGYANFFPFLQPEIAKFDLDLRNHDQRPGRPSTQTAAGSSPRRSGLRLSQTSATSALPGKHRRV
ncbi:unnamed protein product, partial [Polarella glacialis]